MSNQILVIIIIILIHNIITNLFFEERKKRLFEKYFNVSIILNRQKILL